MIRLIFVVLMLLSCQISLAEEPVPADTPVDFNKVNQPSNTAVVTDEETPVVLEEIAGDRDLTGARPWRPPDFTKQDGALGWSPHAFDVPKGLEVNYQFWLDIYTKYTTDQGLLHDSEYIDLIYEVLDFTDLSSRADINPVQKSILRTRAVKAAKKRVTALLTKLQNTKDPSTLSPDEKKVWDRFANAEGKKKFIEASKGNRLRFQLGQRDRIVQGIFFSGRYLEDFETIFKEAGLPIELTRLPFVESSYNVMARSKVGASGLWQIMRYTSGPFLKMDQAVDKRNYPLDATRLAAKLLRTNYGMLESWPLAVTGWNHGPAGVGRLTHIYKSRELGDLILAKGSSKRLGFASRNFYASFLAALEAERNAPKYFGTVYWSNPLDGVEIKMNRRVQWKDIMPWFDGNDKIAQIFNPHISSAARKQNISIPSGTTLLIPVERKDDILNQLNVPELTTKSKKKKSISAK